LDWELFWLGMLQRSMSKCTIRGTRREEFTTETQTRPPRLARIVGRRTQTITSWQRTARSNTKAESSNEG